MAEGVSKERVMTAAVRRRFFVAGMLLLGGLLYAPRLPAPFVADDHFILWRLQQGGPFGFATRAPTGFYRPLISLHYYLDYWLWELQPFWSHLVNVAWHLLCAWLVAQFVRCWWRDRGWSHEQSERAALLAMGLFLVLPAHVEAVAWFAARADMVATAAAISCLLLARASVCEGKKLYAWLALLCFTLGLFSKESLLSFPLVVWLWLRGLGASQAGWCTLPYWMVAALFWWLRMQAVGGLGAYPGAWETLYQPWRLGLHLLLYLAQLPMPTVLFGLGRDGLDTMLWLGWLGGVLSMAYPLIKRSMRMPLCWADAVLLMSFTLIALLPVLLFKPSPWHFLNSRYSYLASVWLLVLVAGIGVQMWGASRKIRWGFCIVVLVYAVGTVRQVVAWAIAGTIAHSTLQSLRELPADRPLVLISVPDHYRGAYIWRAGLPEAISLLLPARTQQPVYALSRFTMRLAPDTAVIYAGNEARLSRQEDIFLPPEGLQLPPNATLRYQVQPYRMQIDPRWAQSYLLLRYQDGRFTPIRRGDDARRPSMTPCTAVLTPCTEVEQHGEQVGVVHDAVVVGVFRCTVGAKGEQHRQQVSVVHDAVIVHIPQRFGNAAAATNPVHVEDACVYPSEVLLYAKEITLSV